MHPLAIKAGDSAYFSAAQLGGAFSDKIKHRLRIARRLRNYTKDFAGCGLSALIIIQIGEMPDIFGSERHALISQPFHLTAGLPSQCADLPRPPLRPVSPQGPPRKITRTISSPASTCSRSAAAPPLRLEYGGEHYSSPMLPWIRSVL